MHHEFVPETGTTREVDLIRRGRNCNESRGENTVGESLPKGPVKGILSVGEDPGSFRIGRNLKGISLYGILQ